jgi:hypothetical protein
MRKPVYLLLAFLLCQLCACGGAHNQPAPGVPQAGLAAEPATRAEAVSQLDAMATPASVSPQVFRQLKDALRAILEQSSTNRLVSAPPAGLYNQIHDLTSGVDDSGNEGLQWNYLNIGDYDFNSQVGLGDLVLVGVHFGKTKASPDWKSAARFADGNEDGIINVGDVTPIGVNFLRRVAGYVIAGGDAPGGPFLDDGQVGFAQGTRMLTGIRMYHYVPAIQRPYFIVIPVDETGTRGQPSLPSVDFLISDNTRIIGAPGGPSFVSRNVDNLVVLLPDANPSPIHVGDVVVGAEEGGYLLRVLDAQQVGNHVNITGTPGILADVFLQGGLTDALNDLSQVPPEVYTIDLTGQELCNYDTLQASIVSGSIKFLPAADVAVNYNEYGGVTYLRGLVLGGPMDLDMTVQLVSNEWSGPFPPTAAQIPFFEHKLTGYNFDFTAYQNGVPVTMSLQYDVFVGIRGSGNLYGTYIANVVSTYDNIKMGGIFNSQGTQDFNEYTATHGAVGVPAVGTAGDAYTIQAYVRPEIHIKLYGNPVPGNSEDLALTLSPQVTLSAARTSTPSAGYDYVLSGSMDTSYNLQLHHIGLDSDPQIKQFTGALDTLRSGFIPDIAPPG